MYDKKMADLQEQERKLLEQKQAHETAIRTAQDKLAELNRAHLVLAGRYQQLAELAQEAAKGATAAPPAAKLTAVESPETTPAATATNTTN